MADLNTQELESLNTFLNYLDSTVDFFTDTARLMLQSGDGNIPDYIRDEFQHSIEELESILESVVNAAELFDLPEEAHQKLDAIIVKFDSLKILLSQDPDDATVDGDASDTLDDLLSFDDTVDTDIEVETSGKEIDAQIDLSGIGTGIETAIQHTQMLDTLDFDLDVLA